MEKILTKKSFPQWVEKLSSYKIYAPVRDNDVCDLGTIHNPKSIDLECAQTVLSPKKIIFPQREIYLEFETSDENSIQLKEILPEETPSVIFGVRPCDAKALALTDKVFGGDFKDP